MKGAVPCAIHVDSVNAFNTSHFKIVIKRYYGDKKTLKSRIKPEQSFRWNAVFYEPHFLYF